MDGNNFVNGPVNGSMNNASMNTPMGGIVGGQPPEPPKKSILPIILVLVLLIGVGVGCYFIGSSTCKKCSECSSNTTDNNSDNNSSNSNNTNTNDNGSSNNTETKSNKVAAGSDTNTSGKNVVDSKTKNVTIGGNDYELKIEVLSSSDGSRRKYQNVYINGYKFISDQTIYEDMIYDDATYTDDKFERELNTELGNVKVFKDTANSDEYLVFNDFRNVYGKENYLYFVKLDGTLLKKITINMAGFGVYIESDIEDPAFEKNEATQYYVPDKKYILGKNGIYTLGSNYIYYISAYSCISIDSNGNQKLSADVSKMVITNGQVLVSAYKTYTTSDEYNVYGAGGQFCEYDGVKHPVN